MSPWEEETARSYGELGEQAHVAILRPVVERLLGDLGGRRVLDFGCGPGQLSQVLVELGAEEVVAVDEQPEMVREATRLAADAAAGSAPRIEVHHGDEGLLDELGEFDVALCSLALMMCATAARLRATVAGLMDRLVPGGRALLVLTHPCFRHGSFPTFHYEVPPGYDYWASGVSYRVVLHPPERAARAVITDYHWTLEDYVSAVTGAGGAVTALRELPASFDGDGGPEGPPAYLVLLAVRQQASVGG